ncbi:MAG: hypothetical protein V1719_01740, partial [Patescibacteria group bacterium]
ASALRLVRRSPSLGRRLEARRAKDGIQRESLSSVIPTVVVSDSDESPTRREGSGRFESDPKLFCHFSRKVAQKLSPVVFATHIKKFPSCSRPNRQWASQQEFFGFVTLKLQWRVGGVDTQTPMLGQGQRRKNLPDNAICSTGLESKELLLQWLK